MRGRFVAGGVSGDEAVGEEDVVTGMGGGDFTEGPVGREGVSEVPAGGAEAEDGTGAGSEVPASS